MAEIEFRGLRKVFDGGTVAVEGLDLADRRRRVPRARRPVRLRQDDSAAHGRRSRAATSGDVLIGGEVVNDIPPTDREHRDGLPELRAVPAHDRVREHGVRAQAAPVSEGRDPSACALDREDARNRRAAGAQAVAALRRPAPAGRDGPRDRPRARRVSSWTSRSRTSTRSCASRCARISRRSTSSCGRRRSTSRTTRPRR